MAHNIFCHSQNDNQTHRLVHTIVNGQPVTQKFEMGCDVENRLVSVTGGNGTTFSVHFTYNGDGQRVKSVVNGETILFIGGHYELNSTTGEVSRYYFAGASRIAVRKYIVPQTTTLTYLVGDHLGSTSLAVDASTGDVIETRYKPWGEVRYTTPNATLPTRYTFTGQYSHMSDDATDLGNAGFGLMFYNARWYDPVTGRFAQADTIVSGGVQGLDRYAYVNNSPVNYVDPSGHFACEDSFTEEECKKREAQKPWSPPHGELKDHPDTATLYAWYLDLYFTLGWWNGNQIGNFTIWKFINMLLSMEFFGPAKDIPSTVLLETVVRNFYS